MFHTMDTIYTNHQQAIASLINCFKLKNSLGHGNPNLEAMDGTGGGALLLSETTLHFWQFPPFLLQSGSAGNNSQTLVALLSSLSNSMVSILFSASSYLALGISIVKK